MAHLGLFGVLMERHLFSPVTPTRSGVDALSNPGFPIPDPGEAIGELLELSDLLEEVQAGLKELDIAKVIQNNSFLRKSFGREHFRWPAVP